MKKRNAVLFGLAGLLVSGILLSSCTELKDNLPAPVASSVNVHPSGWKDDVNSPDFHGRALKAAQWSAVSCAPCHGGGLQVKLGGANCFDCHPAYPHSASFAGASGGHQGYLASRLYPLNECQTCHGISYVGGILTNVSCTQSGCHVDRTGAAKSPEACNTCHGDFHGLATDFLSAAPPRSLAGDTLTSARGVGAHQKHLQTGILGKTVKCQECHAVPSQLHTPGHPNGVVLVAFNDTLARLPSGNGTLVPNASYDPATQKCNNTYCHGSWKLRKATAPSSSTYQDWFIDSVMTGANFAPVWNAGSSQATCTTCHASVSGGQTSPVPTGHSPFAITECSTCHIGVVDAAGSIVNNTKHINGKINVYNTERSF